MKKILILTLTALIVLPTATMAQRRRARVVEEPISIDVIRDSINAYNFEKAQEMLETEIGRLAKKNEDSSEQEALLTIAENGQSKLAATERVTFIDSMIVDKDQLIASLQLSTECGKIYNYGSYFNQSDTQDCTVYQSQLGNQIIFGQPDKNGAPRLYISNLMGNKWSDGQPLTGLSEEDKKQNYPFMLSDGATLYFAAENEEGLGGYDIYMTRYDSDEKTFLEPENIGMPFNSPANDYLYVIDEFNNLGMFATDRNQPEGKVCIYTFIPNATRKIYNEDEIGSEKLRSLARINSIRESWTDMAAVQKAQDQLQALRSNSSKKTKTEDFYFVVDNTHVYTTAGDFKNAEAKQKIKFWQESSKDLKTNQDQLSGLRARYAGSNAAQREQLAAQLRILESKVEALYEDVNKQAKDIRKLELGAK